MSDTSVGSQSPGAPELVEILKQLGSHQRKAWDQTYGKEHWTHEESDAYWRHPVLLTCRWLEEHSGIKREDLEAAAFRLTTPLGLRGMADLQGPNGRVDKGMPDRLWMIPKFRELDRDGTTAKLWQMLLDKCPAVLVETGLLPAMDATPPARKPDDGEGDGGADSTTKENHGTEATTRKPKPSEEKAYGQWKRAIEVNAELDGATDRAVHDWVGKNMLDEGESLRAFGTWQRQLRAARSYRGERKNQPRAGRSGGKSVVRQDQI